MRIFILICFVALVLSETIPQTRGDEFNNPQFVKILNNYFGCKTWNGDVCTQCSAHYYFNKNGICCQVKPQCKTFNKDVGICEQCYEGYGIQNGQCVANNLVDTKNVGCKTWSNGKCVECSSRWYFNSQGVCQAVDNSCRTWNTVSGECLTCYNGYVIESGKCIIDAKAFRPASDSLCAQWQDRVCIKCADRSYFGDNAVCKGVSTNCATWDNLDGSCLTCYFGYDLVKGECVFSASNNAKPSDLGCKRWDWNKQVCLECSARWVFNAKGVCTPVSDNCRQHSATGACSTCYQGYDLVDGSCVFSASNNAKPSDLGCKTWDWNKQVCLECSARWVFNAKGVCTPVSDNCKSYDSTGACSTCYDNYQLVNGSCQQFTTLCKTFGANGSCGSCFSGYVLYQNNCVPLSKLADIVLYYSACCPQKLQKLKQQGRM